MSRRRRTAGALTAALAPLTDTTYLGRAVWNGRNATIYDPQGRTVAHLCTHDGTVAEYNRDWRVTGKWDAVGGRLWTPCAPSWEVDPCEARWCP